MSSFGGFTVGFVGVLTTLEAALGVFLVFFLGCFPLLEDFFFLLIRQGIERDKNSSIWDHYQVRPVKWSFVDECLLRGDQAVDC